MPSVVDQSVFMRRITVEYAYPTVLAHRYFTSLVHLVSGFFFYMKDVNEGTFVYSNAGRRGMDRLTATVKCTVDLSQIKPDWKLLLLYNVMCKVHFEVLCNK